LTVRIQTTYLTVNGGAIPATVDRGRWRLSRGERLLWGRAPSGRIGALPGGLNQPARLLADTGFFSAHKVEYCQRAGIEALIAVGREGHHPNWRSRYVGLARCQTTSAATDFVSQ
jgi:hypothetical protein